MVNNRTVLRSSASTTTPVAALDAVLDKLERQVVREKERPRSMRERHHEDTVSVGTGSAITVDVPAELSEAGE